MRSGLGAYIGRRGRRGPRRRLPRGRTALRVVGRERSRAGRSRPHVPHRRRAHRAAGPQPERPRGRPGRGRIARRARRARARHRDRPAGRDQGRDRRPRSGRCSSIAPGSTTLWVCRRSVQGTAASPDWAQPISGLGPGVEVDGSIANAQRFDSSGQPILDAVDAVLADDPRPVPGHPGQPRAVVLVRPPHAAAPDPTRRPSPADAHRRPGDVPRVAEAQPVTDRRGAPRPEGADTSRGEEAQRRPRRDRDHVLEHGHGCAERWCGRHPDPWLAVSQRPPRDHHLRRDAERRRRPHCRAGAHRRSRRGRAALDHGRSDAGSHTRERASTPGAPGGQPGRGRRAGRRRRSTRDRRRRVSPASPLRSSA